MEATPKLNHNKNYGQEKNTTHIDRYKRNSQPDDRKRLTYVGLLELVNSVDKLIYFWLL